MGLNKKSVDDINVKGLRVLCRCDFNVPLKEGKITDENRLVAALPTIKKLVADGGKMCIRDSTHGVGWCAPQQGACKLSLNVKNGIIEEALVETIGCSGMTHSAAMAAEILQGKTILEALNTDLVCDAINTAMR